MLLSSIERLTLISQLRALESEQPDKKARFAELRECLASGFKARYQDAFDAIVAANGVTLADEVSPDESREVEDILSMHRDLQSARMPPHLADAAKERSRFAGFAASESKQQRTLGGLREPAGRSSRLTACRAVRPRRRVWRDTEPC
jgi:uncharacterized protein YfbU (UPF0304 family)